MRARLAALIFVALTTTQVALPCSAQSLTRCTSVIVGKDATADGSVLLGHNEDLGNHAAQHYIVVEAADHAPGSVEVLYGGTIVPQVDHTHGYVTSTLFDVQYIPGDATGGINDQGLMVANNLAYRRDVPWVTGIHDRVLWSEFTRLALARAATAREAVNVIGGLVETYGLGLDSGTMVGVADSQEGWWIEIAYGGQWAAERVPDDGMAIRANTFRIGEMDLDDTDNFLASPDLVAFATDKGWYTHGPFVFSEVYGDPSALNASWNTHREDRLGSQLALVMPAVTPADLMALWRDHYEGTPLDETDGYTLGTPHQTTEYCLCARAYGGDGGPGPEAYLSNPHGVSVDSRGRVVIADTRHGYVRRVDEDGIIHTIAGTGFQWDKGDGGPASSACMLSVNTVAHGPNDDIYLADGTIGRVRRIDARTDVITTVAGVGATGYSGDGGPATGAGIGAVNAICFDGQGNMYLADSSNHAVRVVTPDGTITTLVGTGEAGFSDDGTAAAEARLNGPNGIAVTADGTLYVCDTNNNRIRRVAADGALETVAGCDSQGDAGDDGPATAASLNEPYGICLFGDDVLLVSDYFNNRIRAVTL